ncbi:MULTISPECIES: AraC family transcriptional regulator [Pseudomonas syringae group]|uniref:Transcriptional regulator n=2 Tax=Pseudomonas syringae group TaxID=136849 RepID=A0A2K4W6K2_9PSED|nr:MULTISPECIES: AraC family transcriptional regulator [Pseudomonas syringae group]EGH12675.1 helix-turn-helix, AraC type:AraC-type transcriptional regulator [Pseudomonas amygdali pv. morsprunorum str. M302280]KWS60435.1 AraC family transcriptional regulator [Pseudomonas amygdali pv. morsprunorum]PHN38106.1 AraC family transcriptional regulator [Pseudomonas avellanae]POC84933.1 AraC family transcriptional regulator [Pseudomonas avellanae]POD03193.1 AraC family transcriptional regulator [Pseudo
MDTNEAASLQGNSVYRAEIIRLIARRFTAPGVYETAIAPLHVIRCDAPSELIHAVHRPALCLIVQGRKALWLGDEQYVYDSLSYLVVAVTVPVSGRVIEASADAPYLCIRLDFDPVQIAQLIADAPLSGVPDEPQRGLFLDHIDQPLLETVLRLVRLLDTPRDIGMLAPLALRELYYRLLHGNNGRRLYEMAVGDSQTQRVTRAVNWLNAHYAEPLRIDELARVANLGNSTLHHRFKALTAMSPLQYQKQLRLQEARRLMINEGLDVSSACYRVGYESPSQFSREYSRQFGCPPSTDLSRVRQIV